FIKSLRDFEPRQFAARDEPPHDVGQIKWFLGRPLLENRRAEKTQPIINVPHLPRPKLFVIANDLAVAENHVAGIVQAFVPINGHQAAFAGALKNSAMGAKGVVRYESPNTRKNLPPSLGNAWRKAPPVPRSVGPSKEYSNSTPE